MKFWMWRGQFLLPWCPFDKMTTATDWGGSGVSYQNCDSGGDEYSSILECDVLWTGI